MDELNQSAPLVWQEILVHLNTEAALWQLSVIIGASILAWAINGALRAYVMRYAPEKLRMGIGGINRVLFPLSTLIFIWIAKLILSHWQHTGFLLLAIKLLLAMAVIRIAVYAVRYIIAPGGLLKTLEHVISGLIWVLMALHLSGLQTEMFSVLESVEFSLGKTPINLLIAMQGLLSIVLTIFVALWVSRMIENRLMTAQNLNMNMRVVLTKLLRILLLTIAVLIALSAVGLDITVLSVFGGALGIGLGFGLQRIASNYVSGFIILLDKSMQIGDVATIDSHYGVVSDLRTRYLVLRKLDGTEVIIPNETLIITPVINHSLTDRTARVQMPVQISYESPLELALQLMEEIAHKNTRVLKDPEAAAQIKGFGDSGIDLMLSVWISDPEEGTASLQSDIYLQIWRAFQQHNISIPFPQREVRILGGG